MNYLLLFLAMSFVSGCGAADKTGENEVKAQDTDNDGSRFELKGSITSAFDVTVDGVDYPDLETFYTQEVGRLPEKVSEQGYKGWSVKFDAKIGFIDLYSGMKLFAQSTSGRGYQAQGSTRADGNFLINMPEDAEGDTYKVRGVKRISILLTKGEESRKFCYNFGPQDMQVPYGERDKPIIMNSFTTRITAYECIQETPSGVEIPPNADPVSGDASIGLLQAFDLTEEVKGMAADNTAIYVMLQSGIIKKMAKGQLTDQCVLPVMGTGLAWDGSHFYTIIDRNRSVFGKFSADCSLVETIDSGLSALDNGADVSVRNGKLYWTRYGLTESTNKLMVLDLNSKLTKSLSDVSSREEKTYFYLPNLVKGIGADGDGFVWAVFQNDTGGTLPGRILWRYDPSVQTGHKWMALPVKDFPDLQKIAFLAVQDDQNILLGTPVGAGKFAIYSVNGSGM